MTDALPASFSDARDALAARLVGVIPTAVLERRLRLEGAEEALPAARPLVADIALGAYLDLSDTDVPVSIGMLEEWGADLDDVIAHAVQNRADEDASIARVDSILVVTGVAFAVAAARRPAVVRSLWDAPGATPEEARPVVLVPDIGTVIVADAADPAAVALAATAAERVISRSDRLVSITPLTPGADGGWTTFAWPADAEIEAMRLRRRWENIHYASARPLVRAALARSGDVFVAEAALAEDSARRALSYAALTEGVDTVLPHVDQVVLEAADGRLQRIPFRALEDAGVIVPADESAPAYVRVTRFPSELL